MRGFPFRRRIALWSTLLAAIVLLVSGVCAALFIQHRGRAELQEEMEAEAAHFTAELKQHGGVAVFDWSRIDRELREWLPPENSPRLIEIHTKDGQLRFRSKELPSPGYGVLNAGARDLTVAGHTIMVLTVVQDGVTFSIGTSLAEVNEMLSGLLLALAAALPVALLIAWLGSRWLAARAVRPVEEITAAAEQVTAARFDQRVPVPPVADEIQRLATVLNTTLDRLERSYAQASRFSADASHELKTPVTVLRSSIEALLDSKTLSAADHPAVAGLLEETHRLSNIIGSLLLLARADTNQLVLHTEGHELGELIGACVEDARILAAVSSITVVCSLSAPAPARVDPIRFSQILSNLLDNAVKYNRQGGEVRVTLSGQGPAWELRIGNTGPGIAAGDRPRIFERFFRAEHTADRAGQGLGLSLSRELALAHGGEIVLAESAAGWTEFLLTLPRHSAPASTPAATGDLPSAPHLQPTMKTTTSLLLTLGASLGLTSFAFADELPKVKGIDRIPAAAAQALVKYAAGHSMKIEKVSTEKHGKVTVHEAELTAAGQPNHEVAVTSDGKVKGEEETVPLDTVPEAARKAITDGAKGAKISRVQKIQEDGLLTYEALYVTDKGKKTEVEYLADGKPKPEEK